MVVWPDTLYYIIFYFNYIGSLFFLFARHTYIYIYIYIYIYFLFIRHVYIYFVKEIIKFFYSLINRISHSMLKFTGV
ncbi:MAG: hypothetical protein N7Q72_03160, partial [Spiroplasma sp. Tabriz.8]|nr:hypothetical protein [Candidatus Phytoplasma australiense]MCZ8632244.1 hypothetical protein [Spiroplasma sp. Tabriz.8]